MKREGDSLLKISKEDSLADEEIILEIQGARDGQVLTIKAETVDDAGEHWRSEASFIAANGRVEVATQAPFSGTYELADGMGLFWSLQPVSGLPKRIYSDPGPLAVRLSLWSEGRELEVHWVRRFWVGDGVMETPLCEEGLVGAFYMPSKTPSPSIILTLSGGSGGVSRQRARLLASHGFASLALGYFGAEGLPRHLENIPLEYFEKAIAWLRKQPKLEGKPLGILGTSRGAELALILATLFPRDIQSVVVTAPTATIHPALGPRPEAAWLWQGKPVGPCVPSPLPPSEVRKESTDPRHALAMTPFFLKMMEEHGDWFEKAAIPVEKIQCPLLMVSGGDDRLWPASLFCRRIQQRFETRGGRGECVHLNYPEAGHLVNVPYVPLPDRFFLSSIQLWMASGGTPWANEMASRDSWKQTQQFFRRTLG